MIFSEDRRLPTTVLFDKVHSRTILYGEAGSGKTTVIEKIALEWSQNETSIYDLVLVVKMSQLDPNKSIIGYFQEVYFGERGVSDDDVEDVIRSSDTLIIIDGWDEVDVSSDDTNYRDIKRIVQRQLFKDASIIVTTRPGIANIHDFDAGYFLNPLNDESIVSFLNRFAKIAKKEPLDYKNHPFRPLLKVPLFLWYFVLLHDNLRGLKKSHNRTDIFRYIIEGLKMRCREKTNENEAHINDSIHELEKQAYACLSCGKDVFKSDDAIFNTALAAGLISKQRTWEGLHNCSYQFIFTHRSILEFLAASFVVQKSDILSHAQDCINIKHIQTSLFLQFLIGLLKTKEDAPLIPQLFLFFLYNMSEVNPIYFIECIAEYGSVNNLDDIRFPREITLNIKFVSSFLYQGLLLLQPYEGIDYLKLECRHMDASIDCDLLSSLLQVVNNVEIDIIGDDNISAILGYADSVVSGVRISK